ncbi:MAG: 50S ribosomal protein L3 N(5)-glutamine methyltransferase [Betaproteobacteria bacterium]
MTLQELVLQQEQKLTHEKISFGQGTTNATDEAVWLVLWKLGLPLDTDINSHTDILSSQQIQSVEKIIDERIFSRLPAAYLTQEAWLQGVSFYVDPRCIIPRSLIAEVLAEGAIDPWLVTEQPRVLDLCTGNGSLAILCALAWPQAEVTGIDLSVEALQVAAINCERHQLHDRIELIVSDGLDQAQGLYDVIVCNPPYVNQSSMQALPPEFKAEPELALAGGEDGMNFIRQLLTDVALYLSTEGVLILEIGNEHDHFQNAFPNAYPIWLSTSAGDQQVLLMTRDMLQTL